MMDWFSRTWQGFVDWIYELLSIVFNFISNLFLNVFEALLQGVVFVFNSLQPPEFITVGMSSLFNALPNDILYFFSMSGLNAGLAIYGAGVTFRLLRKLFTLGQW